MTLRFQKQWINRDWDTFWGSADNNAISEQLFYIMPYGLQIPYKEITGDIDAVLAEIQDLTGKSDSAMETLRSFMLIFIHTVDSNVASVGLLNGGGSNILPNS